MKKLVLLVALGSFGWGSAFAGNPGGSSNNSSTARPVATATSTQGQQQQQQATAAANNAGNSQSVTFTTPANTTSAQTIAATEATTSTGSLSTDNTIRNVPNVNAPALTSSNDTCMGSISAGAGFVGTGISFGTTWTDKNCLMLKNSRELWNMGMRGAAMARMCMDKLNRDALEMTGFVCPQTEREQKSKK